MGLRMKYWIDTEFIARPFTIDLISIGVVAENGREFYAESNETDWSKASPWTLENVRPQLDGKGMSREYIGYAVRNFTDGDEHPVFWGYFPAYDWVALVWLFGGLEELPFHFPQLCLDIKQLSIELGESRASAPEGKPPPRARRRPLDERGLGVSRRPPSRRSQAPHQGTQESGPSRRGAACRFVCAEDKASVTAARGRPYVMCAKGATVKLLGAPPIHTLRSESSAAREPRNPETGFATVLAERMITHGVRNRCQQLRSPSNRYPFPSRTSSVRRRRWKSLNPKRVPTYHNPVPMLWFLRGLR
jgi:3' exoribonuclease, RNase T-like